MNEAYSTFLDLHTQCLEDKKAQKADLTLSTYKLIEEMEGEGIYDKYLISVKEFIEEHEYCTENQYEIVTKIYRHRFDEQQY